MSKYQGDAGNCLEPYRQRRLEHLFVKNSRDIGKLATNMVKKLHMSTKSQQGFRRQAHRIVQTKLDEELSPFGPEQIGEFVEYPVTVEDGVNAALCASLISDQIAAKTHLLTPIANIRRRTPDLPPVGQLERKQRYKVGVLLVGLDPTAGSTHLLDLEAV